MSHDFVLDVVHVGSGILRMLGVHVGPQSLQRGVDMNWLSSQVAKGF